MVDVTAGGGGVGLGGGTADRSQVSFPITATSPVQDRAALWGTGGPCIGVIHVWELPLAQDPANMLLSDVCFQKRYNILRCFNCGVLSPEQPRTNPLLNDKMKRMSE